MALAVKTLTGQTKDRMQVMRAYVQFPSFVLLADAGHHATVTLTVRLAEDGNVLLVTADVLSQAGAKRGHWAARFGPEDLGLSEAQLKASTTLTVDKEPD